MKKSIIIVFISFLFTGALHAVGSPDGTGEKDGYRLIWQDLFEDDILDEVQKWTIEVDGRGNGNQELQYYRRENVSIETEPVSGKKCLVLTARKEHFSESFATSGRITTQHKMTIKYGKIEARIKFPQIANGLWPAFWMLGADYSTVGWPRSGEIDILEMGHINGIKNNVQDRYFNGACHWGYYEDGWYPMYSMDKISDYSLLNGFHLFTMTWDENSIKMYLDQDIYPDIEPYYSIEISAVDTPKAPGHYFNKPFFVILNLAVGGKFPGILDIEEVTALAGGGAKMYVDFVKIYQRDNEDGSFNSVSNTLKTSMEKVSEMRFDKFNEE